MSYLLQDARAAVNVGDEIGVTRPTTYAIVEVYGTFVGTVNFEFKIADAPNGGGFLALRGTNLSTGSEVTSTTVPGAFRFNVLGLSAIRAPVAAWTSGAITVSVRFF